MQTKTEDRPRIRIWPTLVICVVAFCAISLCIFIIFPDQALDLWFYFAYMTAACTFLPLPTPQLAMDYGQRYNTFLIAVLGGIGSCISGLIDYSLVAVVFRYEKIARVKTTRIYCYVERLFRKAAFISLVIAAFTPIPFEPVRFLACATQYNRIRFTLAIFIGRTPRYYILGALQKSLLIPRTYLYASIIILVMIEVIRRLIKRTRLGK